MVETREWRWEKVRQSSSSFLFKRVRMPKPFPGRAPDSKGSRSWAAGEAFQLQTILQQTSSTHKGRTCVVVATEHPELLVAAYSHVSQHHKAHSVTISRAALHDKLFRDEGRSSEKHDSSQSASSLFKLHSNSLYPHFPSFYPSSQVSSYICDFFFLYHMVFGKMPYMLSETR